MVYIIGSGPIKILGNIIGAIEKDKDIFRQNRDTMALDTCRLILGEIQRDPKKDTSDENVMKILLGLRKMTLKNPTPDTLLLQMIDTYIPPPVSDQEVEMWFKSQFSPQDIRFRGKKAYALIGETKRNFGDQEINSEVVKKLIDEAMNDIA